MLRCWDCISRQLLWRKSKFVFRLYYWDVHWTCTLFQLFDCIFQVGRNDSAILRPRQTVDTLYFALENNYFSWIHHTLTNLLCLYLLINSSNEMYDCRGRSFHCTFITTQPESFIRPIHSFLPSCSTDEYASLYLSRAMAIYHTLILSLLVQSKTTSNPTILQQVTGCSMTGHTIGPNPPCE